MKRARLIVLGVAIAAAAGAALLAKGLLKPNVKVVQSNVNMIDVLVAKTDIRLGDSIDAQDLKWQEWPKDAATQGYITKSEKPKAVEDFAGAIARAPFLAGEPIKSQKVIRKSEGGVLAAILPAGMRAISTKIKEETAVGKMILPNDHVDVILSRRLRTKGGGEDFISDTLFRNVRVLAIGQQIEAREGHRGGEQGVRTDGQPGPAQGLDGGHRLGRRLGVAPVGDGHVDAVAVRRAFR